MVTDAEFGRPRVRHSDAKVLILVVSNGQVGGNRAHAITIRSQPAPGLSAYDHPFAMLSVPEVQPQSVGKTVHALINAGSAVAAEIALDVADEVGASKIVFDLEVQAGELRRGAEFA